MYFNEVYRLESLILSEYILNSILQDIVCSQRPNNLENNSQ